MEQTSEVHTGSARWKDKPQARRLSGLLGNEVEQ